MSTAHIRRPADGKRHGNQFYRAGAGTNSQMGMTLCGADATSDDASWADMARKREVPATWSLPDFGVGENFQPARSGDWCAECRHVVATLKTEQVRRAGKSKIS